jgi:hypothetical protein
MSTDFTPIARRLGLYCAIITVVLIVGYAVTLVIGFLSLTSPDQAIGDPMFSILEILIILMMPAMVGLMIAVHAWTPTHLKTLSLAAVLFMALLAGITCCIHFVVFTLSRQPAFTSQAWLPLFFSFQWPSVAYALDILGWDVFFPLSMLFAAAVFSGNRLAISIRWSMIVSGVLALAGLTGVAFGDMQLRDIGIVGYVGVFLIVAVLLALFFQREQPHAT